MSSGIVSGTTLEHAWNLIPLWYGDRLVGAIGAVHASTLVAEPGSAALDFARHAAVAIENSRLVAETRGRIRTLEAVAAFTELTPTEPERARSEMARLVNRALAGSRPAQREHARRRLTNAEAKLRRHQAASEAGIDPAALIDAINQAQAERVAAHAELNGQPAAQELTRQDIDTMIDSIGDISAALAEAEPQRLTALYDALRLRMVYDPDSCIVDVTVQPRGRVNGCTRTT